MRIIRTLDRIFDRVMTWVDQESLVTSMVRLYAVSAVIRAVIMGILTPRALCLRTRLLITEP